MNRKFKVVFERLADNGVWLEECFTNNGWGYSFSEADKICKGLRNCDKIRNIYIDTQETAHW